MAANPLRLSLELHTDASPAATWALLSDTERFNRAVGFGFRFEELPLPDGTVRRLGRARFLGMEMRWEELPFQYRDRQWYRWERVFDGGPAGRLTGTLRLKPGDTGTDILYSLEVFPRNFIVRPAVAFELFVRTKPKLERVFREMVQVLDGQSLVLEPLADPLGEAEVARLNDIRARIPDAKFAAALASFIAEAPLVEQDRISPLRLAREWEMPQQQVITGCLSAVRAGALTLSWELLCPLCLSPKLRLDRLSEIGSTHCPSCNIEFDGTFSDSVGVSFRTDPSLRRFEVHTECVGSPARQPHVLAQDKVEAGAAVVLELALEPGLYRLRSAPTRDTLSLSVVEDGPSGLELSLGGARLTGRLELGAGPCRISVTNESDRPIQVIFERRTLPPDVLTAGQLLESPGASELLPASALDPAGRTETTRCAVLAVELPDAAISRLEEERPRLAALASRRFQVRPGQIVATFGELSEAIEAARDINGRERCRLSIGVGPVLDVTSANGEHPMGRVVDRTLTALWGAAPGRPAMDADLANEPELQSALVDLKLRLDLVDLPVARNERIHRLIL